MENSNYGQMNEAELSRIWREKSQSYIKALNAYNALDFEETEVGGGDQKEPIDTRTKDLADAVLNQVRQANKIGKIHDLRKKFPPMYWPFADLIREKAIIIGPVLYLSSKEILLRIGAPYQNGWVILIRDQEVSRIPEAITFGQSPDGAWIALAKPSGIEMRNTAEGHQVKCVLKWPTGLEGIPTNLKIASLASKPSQVTQLIPFPDGQRALLMSPDGIFVLTTGKAIRLYPDVKTLLEMDNAHRKKYPHSNYPLKINLSMEHGAISPDGRLIAIGCQDSPHLIFNNHYELIGKIESPSEYPHFALFSNDSQFIMLNSCHFYDGMTIGFDVSLLPNLNMGDSTAGVISLDERARIYSAVCYKDLFIVGDAQGYIAAFDRSAQRQWMYFMGGTITGLHILPNGEQLVVTTASGILSFLNLNTGEKNPYAITDSTHQEIRRWLFWKDEERFLIW